MLKPCYTHLNTANSTTTESFSIFLSSMPGTMQVLLWILFIIIAVTFKRTYCYIPFVAEEIEVLITNENSYFYVFVYVLVTVLPSNGKSCENKEQVCLIC